MSDVDNERWEKREITGRFYDADPEDTTWWEIGRVEVAGEPEEEEQVAICFREEDAHAILRDHGQAQRVRELEAALRRLDAVMDFGTHFISGESDMAYVDATEVNAAMDHARELLLAASTATSTKEGSA